MTDEADRADIQIQGAIDAGLRAARAGANVDTSNPGGTCWNCDDKCGTDRRWCTFDCMNEWEKRQ